MSASELPLKIRADVRDLWDSPKSHIQAAVSSLETVLGHKIAPVVRWSALWDELKSHFSDKSTFVPTISRIVVVWYERLLSRLENDALSQWTEELLTLLAQGSSKKELHVDISTSLHAAPQTSWRANSFYLAIPKAEPPAHGRVVAAFDQGFDNFFAQSTGGSTAIEEDGWDEVTAEPTAAVITHGSRRTEAVPTQGVATEIGRQTRRLPRMNELPSPYDLFATTGPYIITIDYENGGSLRVKSSHQPSIELLAAYFNRWGQPDVNNSQRRNIFNCELYESALCSGVKDSLLIHNWAKRVVNVALILAFIEGTLGYKLVYTNGSSWVYRTDSLLE